MPFTTTLLVCKINAIAVGFYGIGVQGLVLAIFLPILQFYFGGFPVYLNSPMLYFAFQRLPCDVPRFQLAVLPLLSLVSSHRNEFGYPRGNIMTNYHWDGHGHEGRSQLLGKGVVGIRIIIHNGCVCDSLEESTSLSLMRQHCIAVSPVNRSVGALRWASGYLMINSVNTHRNWRCLSSASYCCYQYHS